MASKLPSMMVGWILGVASAGGVAAAGGLGGLDHASQLLVDAEQDVYAMGRHIAAVGDPATRSRLDRLQAELTSELAEARLIVARAAGRPDAPPQVVIVRPGSAPPPMGPPGLHLTQPAELQSILAAVRAESFDSSRLAVLRTAASGRLFTSGQIVQLLDAFVFDDTKVDAGDLLFDHVADPGNWYTVFSAFTFGSSKEELRERTSG